MKCADGRTDRAAVLHAGAARKGERVDTLHFAPALAAERGALSVCPVWLRLFLFTGGGGGGGF